MRKLLQLRYIILGVKPLTSPGEPLGRWRHAAQFPTADCLTVDADPFSDLGHSQISLWYAHGTISNSFDQ